MPLGHWTRSLQVTQESIYGVDSWAQCLRNAKEPLHTGEIVHFGESNLAYIASNQSHASRLVSLSKHSTLPKLRPFKPRRVIPNTLNPRLRGLDWLCLDRLFEGVLSPLGPPTLFRQRPQMAETLISS